MATAKSIEKQRKLGSYYTPLDIAQLLSYWAIQCADDLVLEPGFGGCGFIEASVRRFKELDVLNPVSRIFGCDKDPDAFDYLSDSLGLTDTSNRFLRADFLQIGPEDFKVKKFNAVIGNPPYVSLHRMSETQRASSIAAMAQGGFELDGKASLWAYFVLHALEFLKPGGKCAWVLPSSFLHSDYAQQVRAVVRERFSRVVEISIEERLFTSEGTSEISVVVLLEGYDSDGPAELHDFHVADVKELRRLIGDLSVDDYIQPAFSTNLPKRVVQYLSAVEEDDSHFLLGDLLDVKIGIVTGANKFFIINREIASEWDLPSIARKAIFAKFSQTAGLEITDEDLTRNNEKNLRCILVDTSGNGADSKAVKKYLESFSEEKKSKNATFKKRSIWHQPDDGRTPDAFLSYMSQHGPRLVLNSASVTSTNTIHRVFFKDDVSVSRRKLIAISLMSTFTQLSAEIVGRSYGSGVLKLEPTEAKSLRLLLPNQVSCHDIETAYNDINILLRSGELRQAQNIADELVMFDPGNRDMATVRDDLSIALKQLKKRRIEPRKSDG